MVILVACWTFMDSKNRGSRLNPALRVLYIITVPISTFVYLAATRSIKGVGWWTLNLIALYVVLAIGFYGAFYGLYYSDHWELMDPIFFH